MHSLLELTVVACFLCQVKEWVTELWNIFTHVILLSCKEKLNLQEMDGPGRYCAVGDGPDLDKNCMFSHGQSLTWNVCMYKKRVVGE